MEFHSEKKKKKKLIISNGPLFLFYQIQLIFFIETICKPVKGALYSAAFTSAEPSEVNTKNTEEPTHKQS